MHVQSYAFIGENPLFGVDQFERIFRISRPIFNKILVTCQEDDTYFQQGFLINGEEGVAPEAKVTIALKQLAFGCSSSAFLDYFQMGETTGRKSLKQLCKVISRSNLCNKYLRKMDSNDAKELSALHETEFGIPGCLGCLDCMHIAWRTCPAAWKGQFEGKEGFASVALEAVADYNTWNWHCKFGYPGTLNNINIWDQSTLLRDLIDGTFSNIDFQYEIAGNSFKELFLLVDGIYPELSRFVKTLSVPLTDDEKRFSAWQEGFRKAVERAFGILQRKFQILSRPIEYWYLEEVTHIVETCIILHNMMVEVRIERFEKESKIFDDNTHEEAAGIVVDDKNGTVNNEETINNEDINEDNNVDNIEDNTVDTIDDNIADNIEDNNEDNNDLNISNEENNDSNNNLDSNDLNIIDNDQITFDRGNSQQRIHTVQRNWILGSNQQIEQARNTLDDYFNDAERRWDDLYNANSCCHNLYHSHHCKVQSK